MPELSGHVPEPWFTAELCLPPDEMEDEEVVKYRRVFTELAACFEAQIRRRGLRSGGE